MHEAAVRRYQGPPVPGDTLTALNEEIMPLLRRVPGFVAWYAVRDGDDLVAVTVGRDRSGADAAMRLLDAWIRQRGPEADIASA